MSAPHSVQSIPDTALGLTTGELSILRHQQQVMAQRSHQSAGGDRGRGTSRHSQPSSRGTSAASSQGAPNRVILEPRQLQALSAHLDNVMRAIENRIEELEEKTQASVAASSGRHGQTAAEAEAAVRKMRQLIESLDALDNDLKRVKNIKNAVKQLRARVDSTSDRIDRSSSSHQGESRHSSHQGSGQRHTSGHHGADRHRR